MGTAGLLHLMIKEYLDMNFVKLIIWHTFVWVGLVKQLYHRYLLVYLKYIPRKYKVQHTAQLHTGGWNKLCSLHICVHIYRYTHI